MSKITFSEETLKTVREIIARYPEGKQKSALIPLLHIAQSEFDGWLSPEVMDYIADILHIKPIEVYEVASFYTMFNLKPVGKCLIEVCQTSSCWLMGANEIVEHIYKRLGIKPGETTADGMFTLKTVECLGSCGTAPMLMIGADYHENLTFEKVDNLIEKCRQSGKRSSYLVDNMLG
ncbi:MAG TPA: NADH-quinone oxidoreductase subunit NuoE [Saprospiraceae bacterium]|nr:NADH-quinone oxidoreductase subunit NuoE [Saprospiraceae bacterium]HMV25034.1 NADH-quinone oxidoreductase subunit NuoE [Saprospiraceae bacterium]HMX83970.1 NADH-quinone oxidoreductase subunit NuoE [Saprospiraceae bacterium]HMX86015.1 NADH-quinone oxidoreductase subunit NuoE [Saprospiraceae bacterium]HMZ74104.1 NADH-quinone oxidoreductase subunit NuoE [Saprospiraceae bacterium]